ncbi:MAG TPA: hypothetical protein VGZ52_04975 [Acidimicrobiales bacterium]|nr:hypothetical protein [Acidimicrobiales bacterium]
MVGSGTRLATGRLSWGHTSLVHRFVDAVLDGTPPPVSIDDALEVVALTDGILAALTHVGR